MDAAGLNSAGDITFTDGEGNEVSARDLKDITLETKNDADKLGFVATKYFGNVDNPQIVAYEFTQSIEQYTGGKIVVARVEGDQVILGGQNASTVVTTALNNVSQVCGEFTTETDSATGERKVKVKNGTGLYLQKNNASFGLYMTPEGETDAVLTGGIVIEKLNDNTVTTHIKGDRVIVGTVDDQTAQTMQSKFGELDGLVAAKATIGQLNALSARVSNIEADYITTSNLATRFGQITGSLLLSGNMVVTGNGSISVAASKMTFSNTAGSTLTTRNPKDFIRNVQFVANGSSGYKLQYQLAFDADETWKDAGTFSRATTLTGAWSGGVYTVTASPQGNSNSTYLSGLMEVANTTDGWDGNTYRSHIAYLNSQSDPTKKNTGYQVSVDASSRYTAGQNSVAITKGSWNRGQISFTKSAGTASTKSVQLTAAAATWSGNTASVVMWDGTAADVQHGVSTGYTVTVDATARYTAGQNSVAITKGSWSGGQISFTKSAGTASIKSVQLTAAAATWSGTTASVVIWDGTAADVQHGVSTGYTVTVDASGIYKPETDEIGFDQFTLQPSTASIAGRTRAGSFKKSNLSAPGYIFFRVGCRGTNKLYYLVVNT